MNPMKKLCSRAVITLSCALAVLPTLAAAQTASTSPSVATSTSLWQRDGSSEWGATRGQRIRGYRQQSSDLQQKITALGTTSSQGVLMPVLFGVTTKNISPNFGDPRSGGRTHEGEDIMAVLGTPVVSPTAAVVLRTVVGASEGNAVYTANPGGETFVYMHLDRFGEGVAAGSVLVQGSLVGYVGNTGNAAGGPAHLHFEIHNSSGTPTDPFPRLTAEFTPEQKISFLNAILLQTADPSALSTLLTTNFRSTFAADLQNNIVLPTAVVVAMASAPSGPSVVLTKTGLPTRNLYRGVNGEDVRALQIFLNTHGYTLAASGAGSPGNETAYFGPATEAAVVRFQTAQHISPAVGYVGPLTRAAFASLL